MVLVSWHFFGWGLDERCTDGDGAPIAYPAQWAQWVDTREVRLAVCFDECGTLRQGQGECVLLETQDGRTFNLLGADRLSEKIGPAGQFHFGDRVRVWGLLQVTGRRPDSACFCPLQEGDVYGVIVMLNVPPRDDCEGRFEPGDRVVLLVDAPPGPDGKPMTALHCGAQGTVVYHDSARPQAGIFVSWDGFTKGLNADDYCPAPSPPCPPGSGWPVRCDQIGPCNEGRAACLGDRLTVDLSNHQVWLTRGPQCPGGKHTLTGYAYIGIGSSSELAVSANVTPCPGIGGKWKTSLSVDWVPAEEWTSIKVFVDVENIDLSDIPAGKDVLAAGIVMNY